MAAIVIGDVEGSKRDAGTGDTGTWGREKGEKGRSKRKWNVITGSAAPLAESLWL